MKLFFVKLMLLLVGGLFLDLAAIGQTHVNQPLTSANTLGDFYNNTRIILGNGFSAVPGPGQSFKAFISPMGSCPSLMLAVNGNLNNLLTYTIKTPNITDPSQLNNKSTCEVTATVSYMDALGRPIQDIAIKGSPALYDIIKPFQYDQYSRQSSFFLPYVGTSQDGHYHDDALATNGGVNAFYHTPPAGVVSTDYPYSEVRFDDSPLNRPIESSSVGDTWRMVNGHTNRVEFDFNSNTPFDNQSNLRCTQVALYRATVNADASRTITRSNGSETYPNYALNVVITKDENWEYGCLNTTETYTDKFGNKVLTRSYNLNSSGLIEMLSTYYVYDKYNNLCFVLPPMSEPDNANAITNDVLNSLCFQYRYDANNRLIEKKSPGKGWEFFVYNKLNQLAFFQDAIQRNKLIQEWSFLEYDALGRNIINGTFTQTGSTADGDPVTPDQTSRLALQSYSQSSSNLWETRDNTAAVTGYSNTVIPSSIGNITNYSLINYFDDYDIPGLPGAYNEPSLHTKFIQGLATATKTAIVGTANSFLWTVAYYDDKQNMVKVFSQHFKGGTINNNSFDEITNNYDFSGELLATTREHKVNGATAVKITNTYEYDVAGRKLNTWNQINNQSPVLISHLDYNEVGQVVNKKLHSEDGVNFLQTTNYTYNPRGWVVNALGGLFNEQILYDNSDESVPQYNGTISGYRWGPNLEKVFNYEYDKQNRLIEGVAPGMAESNITYDKGGNIKSLTRDGNTISYNYVSNTITTNQLNNITGSGLNNQNYSYDLNGRALNDGSKTNVNYTYNELGLPQTITGTNTINYTYDATGAMLSKNSSATGLTEYISGIQYGSNTGSYDIDFLGTSDGRAVRRTDGTYYYQYDLTDHLGNVRVTFDKDPTTGAARRLQEDDYYPFGLRKSVAPVSLNNQYLFNQKEIQPELNEYDYGARFYDPLIARWNTIDPLADLYYNESPYTFTGNNPANYIDPNGMDWYRPIGAGQNDFAKSVWFAGSGTQPGYEWFGDKDFTFPNYALGTVDIKAKISANVELIQEMAKVTYVPPPSVHAVPNSSNYQYTGPTMQAYTGELKTPDQLASQAALAKIAAQQRDVNMQDIGNQNTSLGIINGVFDGYTIATGTVGFMAIRDAATVSKDFSAIYRGGETFEMSNADLSAVDKSTGYMKPRGVSLNTNHLDQFVQRYGGAFEVDLKTIPKELEIKWTSGTHYELVPAGGNTTMTLETYQSLIKQVKTLPFNSWPK